MGFILILGAAFCWAVDTLIRYPLIYSGIQAEYIVWIEHFFLSLIFFPKVLKLGGKLKAQSFQGWKSFVIIGGLGSALATITFTKAFGMMNPNIVILLQKLQPIVAITMAYFVLNEKISKQFVLLSLLCLGGGFLMAMDEMYSAWQYISQNSTQDLLTKNHFYGLIFTLTAVLGWGASTVFGKKLYRLQYSEKEIMAGRFFIGFVFLIPLTLGLHKGDLTPIDQFSIDTWSKILGMVLISGVLGMSLYYWGLKKTSARLAALAEMFFPLCALGLNWIFLDASLSFSQVLGGALLVMGSTLIQLKHY
jgi:drug/metabolite transporter (DMT)-like permease